MARSARFFLSRITKGGTLDVDKVLEALRKSVSIESRQFAWTVVDVAEDTSTYRGTTYRYLSGKLVKYDPDAMVEVVDEASRKVRLQSEPNMQRAGSLFVYLPDEAVFGHRHLWNEIRARDFRNQLAELIVRYYQNFFVECELLPVADLTRFLTKLAQLEEVTELKARVTPPNPLFGVFWQDLKEYLEKRRLRKLTIGEASKQGVSLPTTAPEIARRIEADSVGNASPAPIGDAAILMAADGYGTAEVTGRRGTETVVVKTTENAIQLKLEADVSPSELAAAVIREVVRLRSTRKLKH
jgi:hypothetical protein